MPMASKVAKLEQVRRWKAENQDRVSEYGKEYKDTLPVYRIVPNDAVMYITKQLPSLAGSHILITGIITSYRDWCDIEQAAGRPIDRFDKLESQ